MINSEENKSISNLEIAIDDKSVLKTEEKETVNSLIGICSTEKCGKTKSDIFKKPVFLVGPRKGKLVGKFQVIKSTDPPDSTTDEKELSKETTEEVDNSTISVKNTDQEKDDVDEKNVSKVSPAQRLNENSVPLPYKEPKWSGIPTDLYKFEVLKNGSIVETIDLSFKPYFVFGRLTTCDIHMAHPTVSRYHAVLQFRSDNTDGSVGFYIYDLGSTHGTFLNKYRIKSNMYVRVHVGHLLKFGTSTRMFILQGPEEDMEKESELSVTELKEKRQEEKTAKELQELRDLEELRLQEEKTEAAGIDWGMGDDADEETDLSENPFAAAPNEELYLDDPKKTLRGWFEREGYDLEYDVEEKGFGQFLCRVEIPVESAKGGTIVAESLVKGKKKEAVVQCALEACRILDRYGLLRQAKHESRKRKVRNWEENDYYDSDEDEFLDRTGTVEKKRQQRMKAAGKIETQTETYDSLVKKHEDILSHIDEIQNKLDSMLRPNKRVSNVAEDEDELDAFMTNLSTEVPDNKLINKLKSELLNFRKEEIHLRKLVNIACPASLPKLVEDKSTSSSQQSNTVSVKRKTSHHSSLPASTVKSCNVGLNAELEGEEEEDDDDEEEEEEKDVKYNIKEENTGKNCMSNIEAGEEKVGNVIEDAHSSLLIEAETDKNFSDKLDIENDIVEENKAAQNKKVIGPTLPPDELISGGHTEKRKKRVRQRQNKRNIKESDISSSSDPNYSMWVPPEDQSGDGRTRLNEKFGY